MSVTYAKLKSGEWGVRGPAAELREGYNVTVTKKDGSHKQETVQKILWTGGGVAVAAIKQLVTERQADAGHGRGRTVRSDCCGYPCPVTGRKCTPGDPCHDCQ